MTTAVRRQKRYDHRLRELVRRTGEIHLATARGVPRSTARGWLGASSSAVVSLNAADRTEAELRQEILTLQRRVGKLAALLRLALVLRPRGGRTLAGERLLDGPDKARLLRAVEGARTSIPLRGILRFLHLSPSRFYAWRRQRACALSDQRSCPRTSPHRLTHGEVHAIEDMVTSPAYRHVPTRTLAILAQRLGIVCASPSTWCRLVRTYGWRRPRLRVHQAKPKVGVRGRRPRRERHLPSRSDAGSCADRENPRGVPRSYDLRECGRYRDLLASRSHDAGRSATPPDPGDTAAKPEARICASWNGGGAGVHGGVSEPVQHLGSSELRRTVEDATCTDV